MKAGIHYGMPFAEYLALPAVSAGILCELLDKCPAAARYQSPWNPRRPVKPSNESDVGIIAHEVFLEGSRERVAVIDPKDHPSEKAPFSIPDGWTNKSIRTARDAARAGGLIPVLKPTMIEVEAMVEQAHAFVDSLEKTEPAIHRAFEADGGDSEVVMIWFEGDTPCKLRADRIAKDHRVLIDYKTSAMCVEPDRFGRTQMVGNGYYMSASWYRRGVRAVTGVSPDYVFLAGEQDPPYLHSLIGCKPSFMELGDEKIGAALREWQQCERTGVWPGYPNRCAYPELPVYERMRWDERNGTDAHGIPYDISKLFTKSSDR